MDSLERNSQFSSVTCQSNSLWPHRLQQTRSASPLRAPRVYSSLCPWSQWCHPTISSVVVSFSSCLQSFKMSLSKWVFPNESALRIRWSKYWSLSISPSNEYSRLISIRFDWLDLLAVQGTLQSLLQYQSLEASILWCSDYIMVQLLCPYMTTGNTIGFD